MTPTPTARRSYPSLAFGCGRREKERRREAFPPRCIGSANLPRSVGVIADEEACGAGARQCLRPSTSQIAGRVGDNRRTSYGRHLGCIAGRSELLLYVDRQAEQENATGQHMARARRNIPKVLHDVGYKTRALSLSLSLSVCPPRPHPSIAAKVAFAICCHRRQIT